MADEDYYSLLGVSRSASQEEIKKAYRQLAMRYHPDRNPDDKGAEKKLKAINEAYDVLKDEKKRATYDRLGKSAFTSSGFNHSQQARGGAFHGDVNDIFGEFFSDFMGGSTQTRKSPKIRGSDLRYNLSLTLEEAFTGVNKHINFSTQLVCDTCEGSGSADKSTYMTCDHCQGHGATRVQQGFFTLEQTCGKCQGSGQIVKNPCKKCDSFGRISAPKNLVVTIPAGIPDGGRIRLSREGEAGIRGGVPGNLHIFISIKLHSIFNLDTEGNLHCKLPLTFPKAALGGEVEIPAIEGGKVKLKIPSGTQSGSQLRLKGKGMSKVRSTERGDMFAHVQIETPKSLTKKQSELLEALDQEFASENSGIFNKMKNLWS